MAHEQLLSDVLGEFARTVVTEYSVPAILDHLVGRIVEILPVTGAGVTVISATAEPHHLAASDDDALHYVQLQSRLREGPCLLAHETGEAVASADLHFETRFPRFTAGALDAGLRAVFTFPLRHGIERMGALDLYRDAPGDLDVTATRAARTLADVAAAYITNAQARSDLRAVSERSMAAALHDPLTGLPNRSLFLERVEHAVLRARRSSHAVAVLFADLDGFKAVNDRHGHAVGDALLVAVARRIGGVLRTEDTLARMSGDEFVVLCEDLDGPQSALGLAARIGHALAAPFLLSGLSLQVSVSIGTAFAGPGSRRPDRLLEDADAAMYEAKRNGGGQQRLFEVRQVHPADEAVGLDEQLRVAQARDELRVEYQPIVRAEDGVVTGAEALLRWAHPTRGLVGPDTVIPLAERAGLIGAIGRWVLATACADRLGWHAAWTQPGPVSVNVSALELMMPDYVSTFGRVLAETGTEPSDVIVEMTETVFLHDSERALEVLGRLKELGTTLALDDFGTGYSSLSYLRRFPIDVVKVDRTFVADMGHDRASHAIVAAVVDLAHRLGMVVVAEGVETEEQHRRLASLGCDLVQGYFYGRAVPVDAFEPLLPAGHPARRLDGLPDRSVTA